MLKLWYQTIKWLYRKQELYEAPLIEGSHIFYGPKHNDLLILKDPEDVVVEIKDGQYKLYSWKCLEFKKHHYYYVGDV